MNAIKSCELYLKKFFSSSKKGMGYVPDVEDSRDHSINDNHPLMKSSLKTGESEDAQRHIIPIVNFTPIKNQGKIGSCTAHAGVAIMEYYIKKRTHVDYDLSEKYLYWVTRRLLGWQKKDTGAYLRTVMQALTRFGVCEEKFSPYNENYVEEPSWVIGQLADDFQAETYLKLDKKGTSKTQVLSNIKRMINRNYPIVFGFTVFNKTINNQTGYISYPSRGSKIRGGHAVVIVGYDDNKRIGTTTGAIKIRNSWGISWGENGYGWLPYRYITRGLANDFWMLFRADWVKLERFD